MIACHWMVIATSCDEMDRQKKRTTHWQLPSLKNMKRMDDTQCSSDVLKDKEKHIASIAYWKVVAVHRCLCFCDTLNVTWNDTKLRDICEMQTNQKCKKKKEQDVIVNDTNLQSNKNKMMRIFKWHVIQTKIHKPLSTKITAWQQKNAYTTFQA